jgi:hypothetical protein
LYRYNDEQIDLSTYADSAEPADVPAICTSVNYLDYVETERLGVTAIPSSGSSKTWRLVITRGRAVLSGAGGGVFFYRWRLNIRSAIKVLALGNSHSQW